MGHFDHPLLLLHSRHSGHCILDYGQLAISQRRHRGCKARVTPGGDMDNRQLRAWSADSIALHPALYGWLNAHGKKDMDCCRCHGHKRHILPSGGSGRLQMGAAMYILPAYRPPMSRMRRPAYGTRSNARQHHRSMVLQCLPAAHASATDVHGMAGNQPEAISEAICADLLHPIHNIYSRSGGRMVYTPEFHFMN